mgnify:CR=1 FL=1
MKEKMKVGMKIEKILNLWHYAIYLFFNQIGHYLSLISPARLLLLIPYYKKKYAEKNINYKDVLKEFQENRLYGTSITYSGAAFTVLVGIVSFLLLVLASNLLGFKLSIILIIAVLLFSVLLVNYTVFNKDKYLKYFEEFDKNELIKKHTSLIVFLTFLSMLVLWVLLSLSFPFLHF